MIAAVWSPPGGVPAVELLEKIAGAVGSAPGSVAAGKHYVVAGWPLAPAGRVDSANGFAVIGQVRALRPNLDLATAACLGGDYALIQGMPSGLLVARGGHAGRPLYTARLMGGAIAVSSTLAPLLTCLDVTPNVQNLGALILAEPSDQLSATVYNEIRRVEASQAVLLGAGDDRSSQAPFEPAGRSSSPDELAEELRAALDLAVCHGVEGARRIAVLVSGGLDSSAVMALAVAAARGANKQEIDAISFAFAGPGDDRPYLSDLCDTLGVLPFKISPAEASRYIVPALISDAAPCVWPTSAWNLNLRDRLCDLGADRLLTGMGGDQVFNGDPRVFGRLAGWDHCIEALIRTSGYFASSTPCSLFAATKLLVGSTVISKSSVLRRFRRRQLAERTWPWAGPRLREVVQSAMVERPGNDEWKGASGVTKFRRLIRTSFMEISEGRGQMEVTTGVMRVDPLLDDELVTLVASFPQEMLLFGDRRRGLFQHAMRQGLPERLRLRSDKAAFEPAIVEMVRGCDMKTLVDLSSMRMLGDLGLVEPERYRQHFRAVLAAGSQSPDWMAIWPALAVEAFVRSHWGSS